MSQRFKLISGILFAIGIFLILLVILGIFNVKEYTVSFNSMGGSDVISQKVKDGEKVVKPNNPMREGFDFAYWSLNDVEYDFSNPVKNDLTLIAKWNEIVKTFDVTLTVGDKVETVNVKNTSEIDFSGLGFEEKEGYEIKWYIDGEELVGNKEITENTSIEGKYVKTVNYTVKFNSDGGTKVVDQKLKPNELAKEPTNVTKYGFILKGWYLNNKVYDFNTPVTKNITLVAKWDEDTTIQRYTVTFDSNGGSKVGDKRVIEGQAVTAPTNPTKSGNTFDGWYLNDKKYDFKTAVTSNIKLVAKWNEVTKHTVTFNSDNGTSNTTVTVNDGEKVTKPSNPTKSGYTFKEWQLNNVTFNFDNPIKSNITLIAVYTKNEVKQDEYTITATRADNYSPDSILKVFKNGSQISVREIKYSDGVHLCDGSKLVVATADISGEKSFKVVLNDGTTVTAVLK